MKLIINILFLFIAISCHAQASDKLNEDELYSLKNWEFESSTYSASIDKNEIFIHCNKTLTSQKWSFFKLNLNPRNQYLNHPVISLKVKTDETFLLQIKPVGSNHLNDWYEMDVHPYQEGQLILIQLDQLKNSPIKEIYFYVNGEDCRPYKFNFSIQELAIGQDPDYSNDIELSNATDPDLVYKGHELFNKLKENRYRGILYGMHDAVGYGVGWKGDPQKSDVKEVCGSYPALFSWEVNHIFDPLKADLLAQKIKWVHEKGGINTFVWHTFDPSAKSFYTSQLHEPKKVLPSLLQGGKDHEYYKESLTQLAHFLKGLRDKNGHTIPILFRPFHEHNGDWFWWGKTHVSESAYIQLWQFTVDYLKDSLEVHNLLYVFSPDGQKINASNPYLYGYPGDDYVDILALDYYFDNSRNKEKRHFIQQVEYIVQLAEQKGKVAAISEIGDRKGWKNINNLQTKNWHTKVVLASIKNSPIAQKIAYMCTWRNANKNHHFAPYPGHPSENDFKQFFDDPLTQFLVDIQVQAQAIRPSQAATKPWLN